MLRDEPRRIIAELCRQFYQLGWVSGSGGSMGIHKDDRIYMTPSGVQKERLGEEDIFVLDESGKILLRPDAIDGKVSARAPIFLICLFPARLYEQIKF